MSSDNSLLDRGGDCFVSLDVLHVLEDKCDFVRSGLREAEAEEEGGLAFLGCSR